MLERTPVPLAGPLVAPLFVLLPALIAVLAAEKRGKERIGRSLAVERPGLWMRRVLLAGPQLAVLAWVLERGDLLQHAAVEVLLFGILLAWLVPGRRDAVLGESGIRRGWSARGFEELEDWRLSEDRLHLKLDGERVTVPCPLPEQARVRGALSAENAAGEVRFPS